MLIRQRSLEAHLATVNDSADLVKAEIEKEEALLAKEKKQLRDMEKNAKRAEAEKKRQMKNVRLVISATGRWLTRHEGASGTSAVGQYTS